MLNSKRVVVLSVCFLCFLLLGVGIYLTLGQNPEVTYDWEITDNYAQTYDCATNVQNLKSCETPIKTFVECEAEHMEVCKPVKPWLDYDDRIIIVETLEESDLAFTINLSSRIHQITATPFFYAYNSDIQKGVKEEYKNGYGVAGGGITPNGNYIPWNMKKLTKILTGALVSIGEIQ